MGKAIPRRSRTNSKTTLDRRKIALLDLDGTLADYMNTMVSDLNAIRSPNEEEFTVENIDNAPDWLKNRMNLIRSVPGWWLKLPKLEDGFIVLEHAVKLGFQPKILTKGPRNISLAWQEKYIWCMENIDKLHYMKLPIDVITTHDKSGEYGTVLVEDYPPYIMDWLKWRPRGQVILLNRPWNQIYKKKKFKHPQMTRFDYNDSKSTQKMFDALEKAYKR